MGCSVGVITSHTTFPPFLDPPCPPHPPTPTSTTTPCDPATLKNANSLTNHYIFLWSTRLVVLFSRAECDIRENFDTNECPNIFVSTKLYEWIFEYIHINFFTRTNVRIKYLYWKLHEYSNIFEYSSRFYTLTHSPTNVWIYSYKQIWHERMSEYIRKRKIDTNECPNIYSWPIYSNIRIFEYIRHTLDQTLVRLRPF